MFLKPKLDHIVLVSPILYHSNISSTLHTHLILAIPVSFILLK